jgi:hypothetical protein
MADIEHQWADDAGNKRSPQQDQHRGAVGAEHKLDIVAAGMVKHARLLLSIAPISNADPDHLPPRNAARLKCKMSDHRTAMEQFPCLTATWWQACP